MRLRSSVRSACSPASKRLHALRRVKRIQRLLEPLLRETQESAGVVNEQLGARLAAWL